MYTVSLIISTYNSPEYLTLCLQSVLRQSVMPDEIVIADDGSTTETGQVIDDFRHIASVPVLHVRHADTGFRLSAIRNKAVAEASSDYIVQIDGDVILGANFIKDHKRFMERGYLLQGSRVVMSKSKSEAIVRRLVKSFRFFNSISTGIEKPENGIRIVWLSRFMLDRYHNRHPRHYARGCNMSFFRNDFIEINGYDEDFTGWGHEDSDLTLRMLNKGIKKRIIKFAAVMYHLYHPEGKPTDRKGVSNMEMMQKHYADKVTVIKNGIDKYTGTKGDEKDYTVTR